MMHLFNGFLIAVFTVLFCQSSPQLDSVRSKMSITGTSTLHDWEIDVTQFTSDLTLADTDTFAINTFKLSVFVESLRSGKESMDENTWEELKYEDYPFISYELNRIKTVDRTDQSFQLLSVGKLTVAGVEKMISLDTKIEISNDSIHIRGEKMLKMTEFGMDPPTMFLGTIRTGNEVVVHYNLYFSNNKR